MFNSSRSAIHPTYAARPATQRRLALQALATAPWWLPVAPVLAQQARGQLDERLRSAKVERGGLSLDIPTLAETGTSVPVVLFVDPAKLSGRTVARFGIIAPQNPRPVALEIELGSVLAQPRLTTAIRLGATQSVIGVAQLSDGTLWQHSIEVLLTGSACFDGT